VTLPHAASAALLTVAINAAIFWFLAVLNASALPDARPQRTPPIRIAQLPPPRHEREPIEVDLAEPSPADEPHADSRELPVIEVAPPDVDPGEVRPLPVDVEIEWRADAPDPAAAFLPPSVAPAATAPGAPAIATAPATAGAGHVPSETEVDEPPRQRPGNPRPAYPRRERLAGKEGSVTVKLLIDERGRVEAVEVLDGAPAFVAAVRKVVDRFRFHPARHRGEAVKVWGTITFHFRLED